MIFLKKNVNNVFTTQLYCLLVYNIIVYCLGEPNQPIVNGKREQLRDMLLF